MLTVLRRMTRVTILVAVGAVHALGAQAPLSQHPRVLESLRLLDMWLDAEQAYERIPGLSIAVVHDQELVWSKGYGRANIARNVSASAGTLYSGCSIAKLFTATALIKLRDEGKVALDAPVERYLDWFRSVRADSNAAPITVANLLTHSSGLVRDLPMSDWTGPEYPFPERKAVIERAASAWTFRARGTGHEYSNVGMMLAGEIVSRVARVPFESYVRKHIFEPLGMLQTSSSPSDPGDRTGLAQGYSIIARDGTRQSIPPYHVRALAPVAGLGSTVEDLAKFAAWQFRVLDGRDSTVLSANSLRGMHQVQFIPADSWTTAGHGYQIWRENDRTFVGHAGTCPGFQSQLLLRPQEKIATVVMINAQGVSPNRCTQRAYDIMSPALRTAAGRSSAEPSRSARPRLHALPECINVHWAAK